jgi:two-component system, cell cycle response regulator
MNKKISVLLVDDDQSLLDVLKSRLVLEGFDCATASTAASALERIDQQSFDIMIADIVLPDREGLELSETAKRKKPDMAIIIMTGYISDFSYDKAVAAGASDFIKKPFSLNELIARIKHVRMQEGIRSLLLRDELTGLYNRRGFFTLVEYLLKMAKRQARGMFMLYADLDNLKQINDIYGHQEGDLALIETANLLRKNYRESDIIARIGGDEFIVISAGTPGDCIDTILRRLQQGLEAYNAKRNRRPYALSLSAGMAYYDPENPCSIDELLAQGDRSMYRHKKQKQHR